MEVPGSVGWPVIGDRSVDFYRDPIKFLEKHMTSNKSKIFATRFLNKPTVFVCSNEGVKDVLKDKEDALELGYEQFLKQIFGDNILFTSNLEALHLRHALSALFTPKSITDYESIIKGIITDRISALPSGSPFHLYQFFKDLFTEMCLRLFLGMDASDSAEAVQHVAELSTAHFRGVVSVPVDVKVPGTGNQSTYGKALTAKSKILEFINNQTSKVSDGFVASMKNMKELNENTTKNHFLLFSCALLPKVLASICTTVCLQIGTKEESHWQQKARLDPSCVDNIILEAQRLHPPLIGGRRIVKKPCVIGGYSIPKDYAIVYMTQPAHRDSAIFDHPDQFLPQRWEDRPELKDHVFVYGMGRRGCIGQKLALLMVQLPIREFVSKFSWQVCEDQRFQLKYLPVSRPKTNVMVTVNQVEE